MHDRASVNDAAMKIVKVIYPNLVPLDGGWEVFKQLMVQFGDLEEFLKSSHVSPTRVETGSLLLTQMTH